MYTLHEETDANGRAVVGLRDGATPFCQVTAPSYAAKSFTAALQALAQQLADNIANDAATRSQLDETQIPEPLASHSSLKRSVAELVVTLAGLWIGEDLIGLSGFLKPLLRGFVSGVFIRVIL